MLRIVALAGLCACSSGSVGAEEPVAEAPSGVQRCAGDLDIADPEELGVLRGCRQHEGDLRIAGGVASLAPLADLREVRGSLRIGPSLRLASLVGLERLRRVGGDLTIASNPGLDGVFLGALREVEGDVTIAHNPSVRAVSLHALERVGGSLELHRNKALARIDLAGLEVVAGSLRLRGHRHLRVLVVGEPAISGSVVFTDNGSFAPPPELAPRAPAKEP